MSGLWYALRHLARDLLAALVFAGLYAATGDLMLATGVSIAVGLAQILIEYRLGRPVHTIQWLSLALVVVLGGTAIFLDDPRFVMIKPTVAYVAVGAVMLKRGWMLPYIPPAALEDGADLAVVFGYLWAALMFVTALGNLVAAGWGVRAWTVYIAVFPVASKVALFVVQYLVMRVLIGRRRRAEARGPVVDGEADR